MFQLRIRLVKIVNIHLNPLNEISVLDTKTYNNHAAVQVSNYRIYKRYIM